MNELRSQEPIHGIFTDLWAAVLEPPKWVIRDLLPVGLTFLSGPPKCGKSTWTLALGILTSGGRCEVLPAFMSTVDRRGPVLYFSAEALAGELRHTAEVGLGLSGEPDESLLVADDSWLFRLDDIDAMARLDYWLEERDPRLVIFDPLRDFHELDEDSSTEMIRMLRHIREWAVRTESAVVIVHHVTKPAKGDGAPIYAPFDMRGSGAMFGKADGVLMLTPLDEAEQKVHVGATFKRGLGWSRTIHLRAWGRQQTACEVLGDLDRKVLQTINNGAASLLGVIEMVHAPERSVRECVKKLLRNGLVNSTWEAR